MIVWNKYGVEAAVGRVILSDLDHPHSIPAAANTVPNLIITPHTDIQPRRPLCRLRLLQTAQTSL